MRNIIELMTKVDLSLLDYQRRELDLIIRTSQSERQREALIGIQNLLDEISDALHAA